MVSACLPNLSQSAVATETEIVFPGQISSHDTGPSHPLQGEGRHTSQPQARGPGGSPQRQRGRDQHDLQSQVQCLVARDHWGHRESPPELQIM